MPAVDVELRLSKYLNNIVEQDHRAVKRITIPMLGFKSFWFAQSLIAGTETIHMEKKGHLHCLNGQPRSAATQLLQLGFLIAWKMPGQLQFFHSTLLRQNQIEPYRYKS